MKPNLRLESDSPRRPSSRCPLPCRLAPSSLPRKANPLPNPPAQPAPPGASTAEPLWWRLVPAHIGEAGPVGTEAHPNSFNPPALDLMIPAEWKLQGQVEWPDHKGRPSLAFHVDSPDGQYGVEYLPQDSSTWSEDPDTRANLKAAGSNVQPLPPTLAADYLRAVVLPKLRPSAQIVAIDPLPEITGYLNGDVSGLNTASATDAEQTGVAAAKNSGDAARARITYLRNGVPVEEWVEIAVEHLQRHAAKPSDETWPKGQTGHLYIPPSGPIIDTFIVVECVGLRAPQGTLDQNYRILAAILGQLRQNDLWTSRVSYEHWHGKYDDRIIYFRSSFFGEDQYSFHNPSDSNQPLSFAYDHVWSNEKTDEFIVTDSATFDPNGKTGTQTWKRLKPWE